MLDCIDYETAVVNKEEIMPRVVRTEVIKHQFQYELIKDELMFKIPENTTKKASTLLEFRRRNVIVFFKSFRKRERVGIAEKAGDLLDRILFFVEIFPR